MATSTFYPDADPETTSVDGVAGLVNQATWDAVRTATDGSYGVSDGAAGNVFTRKDASDDWDIGRDWFLFDTSALPDGDTISAVTFSFQEREAHTVLDADSETCEIVSSSPASNTDITTADYDQIGSTSFGSIAFSSTNQDTPPTYNDVALNASGISNVTKTGISKFAAIGGLDLDATEPTGSNRMQISMVDDTFDTPLDPKLVVTHASSSRRIFVVS